MERLVAVGPGMMTFSPHAGQRASRPANSVRACMLLPHSHVKRTTSARGGADGAASARIPAAVFTGRAGAAALAVTVTLLPQAGHLTRRPAYSSGARNTLPQEQVTEIGIDFVPQL
jgi:hypothetical protein